MLHVNAHFVGTDALRDFGLLDSALMRPQASVFGQNAFPTLDVKAAALLHSLARNHPFLDGNKRTALAATAMFYLVNGYGLSAEQGELVALMVDVAEGQLDVPHIAARLKVWTYPLEFAD